MQAPGSSLWILPRHVRSNIRRGAVAVTAGLLLMVTQIACSGGGSAGGQSPDKIVFGTVPIAGTAAIYVGKKAGYFEDVNIDLKIANAVQFEDIVPNVVNGKYNFGTVSVGTVVTAITENLPIQIAANTYFFNGEQALMVRADSDIKAVADLKGRRIGLGGLNNNFQAGVVTQLEDAGIGRKDVEFTLISPPQIPAALRNGNIAAGQINEPFITSAGDEFRYIIKNAFAPFGEHACNNYVIVNPQWADDNKELFKRFLGAYNKSAKLAASDSDAVVSAVASYTEISPDVLEQMNFPGFGPDLKKQSFKATVRGMKDVGFLDRKVTVKEAFYGVGS